MDGKWLELWETTKQSLRRTALYLAIYFAIVAFGAFIELHYWRH